MDSFFDSWDDESRLLEPLRRVGPHYMDENILFLTTIIWPENRKENEFLFTSDLSLQDNSSIEPFSRELLKHISKFSARSATPHQPLTIIFDNNRDISQLFRLEVKGFNLEEDPVVILDPTLLSNPAELKLVLVYVTLDYVLRFNEIQMAYSIDHHRLIEAAFFVLGFGEIFLSGYSSLKFGPENDYQYILEDDDYQLMNSRANQLWNSEYSREKELMDLEERFFKLIWHKDTRQKILSRERERNPFRSEVVNLKNIIKRYDR
jgi:hypothetical protein